MKRRHLKSNGGTRKLHGNSIKGRHILIAPLLAIFSVCIMVTTTRGVNQRQAHRGGGDRGKYRAVSSKKTDPTRYGKWPCKALF